MVDGFKVHSGVIKTKTVKALTSILKKQLELVMFFNMDICMVILNRLFQVKNISMMYMHKHQIEYIHKVML